MLIPPGYSVEFVFASLVGKTRKMSDSYQFRTRVFRVRFRQVYRELLSLFLSDVWPFKSYGELNNNRNFTIRTSIVGPEIKDSIGLFHWFMKQRRTINGYANAIRGGVTTLVLADKINVVLKQNLIGLVHLTNTTPICKFELSKLFNEL